MSDIWWRSSKSYDDSFIIDIFGGQLMNTSICVLCGYKSISFDTIRYLSLPFDDHQACSIQDLLISFFKEEMIQDPLQCTKCNQVSQVRKKLDMYRNPSILIL